MDKLTEMDRMNFVTLINLGNAKFLIEQLPEGLYKQMASLAHSLRQQLGLVDKNKSSIDSFLGDGK